LSLNVNSGLKCVYRYSPNTPMFRVNSQLTPVPSFTPTDVSLSVWFPGEKLKLSSACATKIAGPTLRYGCSWPFGNVALFSSGARSSASNPITQTERSTSSNTPLTQTFRQKTFDCRPMFGAKCERSTPKPKLSGPTSNGSQSPPRKPPVHELLNETSRADITPPGNSVSTSCLSVKAPPR